MVLVRSGREREGRGVGLFREECKFHSAFVCMM